jgi:uncharacterized protein (DUF2147 family)
MRDSSSLRAFALGLTVAGIALAASPARAAEPAGVWLVADHSARIRIEQCPNGYWGTIDWERQAGIDTKNPDPNKRGRPLLGTPILIAMAPSHEAGNKWAGKVYNPKDGGFYNASITLLRPDVLELQGCMWVFCSGENWTRVPEQTSATTGAATAADQPRHSACPTGTQARAQQRHD